MKQSKFIAVMAFSLMMLLSFNVNAQKFPDLDASPMDAASFPTSYKDANKLIKIVYSRPQLKERSLEKLAPQGKVYRAGANEAAELSLYTDMKLGGKTVKAGTYTFYLIPGEEAWTAIVNTDLNVWGSYFYDESKDVARITVPVNADNNSLEAFSMVFTEGAEGVDLNIGWGTMRLTVPFTK